MYNVIIWKLRYIYGTSVYPTIISENFLFVEIFLHWLLFLPMIFSLVFSNQWIKPDAIRGSLLFTWFLDINKYHFETSFIFLIFFSFSLLSVSNRLRLGQNRLSFHGFNLNLNNVLLYTRYDDEIICDFHLLFFDCPASLWIVLICLKKLSNHRITYFICTFNPTSTQIVMFVIFYIYSTSFLI